MNANTGNVLPSISACRIVVTMSPILIRLRELREARDLSQAQLANLAKTRQATISELETGRARRIEIDLLERLAAALDCEPADLIVRQPRRKK